MARTKASVGAKVSYGKSSKAQKGSAPPVASTSSGKTRSSKNTYGGGNPICVRETPNWQLPITRFFGGGESNAEKSGPSNYQPNESVETVEDLDETGCSEADLLPIVDDGTSHKIADFFPVTKDTETDNDPKSLKNKGKGKGKKNACNDSAMEENTEKENQLPENTMVNSAKKRNGDNLENETNRVKKIKISNA